MEQYGIRYVTWSSGFMHGDAIETFELNGRSELTMAWPCLGGQMTTTEERTISQTSLLTIDE
jgi:hypothetical protein